MAEVPRLGSVEILADTLRPGNGIVHSHYATSSSGDDEMSISDNLLPEFDQEMDITRRVLQRVGERAQCA